MDDPLTDAEIEAAHGRSEALLDSHKHDDHAANGQKEHVDDVPDMTGDDQPPKGWKQDADGNWGPPGWIKRGDTWDGPVPS